MKTAIGAIIVLVGVFAAMPCHAIEVCDDLEDAADWLQSAASDLASCASYHDYGNDCSMEAMDAVDAADDYESAVSEAEHELDGEVSDICDRPLTMAQVRMMGARTQAAVLAQRKGVQQLTTGMIYRCQESGVIRYVSKPIAGINCAAVYRYNYPAAAPPVYSPRQFHGYPCTQDCSGHRAGYEWAQRKGIADPAQCGGNSQSFIEGCRAWAEGQ